MKNAIIIIPIIIVSVGALTGIMLYQLNESLTVSTTKDELADDVEYISFGMDKWKLFTVINRTGFVLETKQYSENLTNIILETGEITVNNKIHLRAGDTVEIKEKIYRPVCIINTIGLTNGTKLQVNSTHMDLNFQQLGLNPKSYYAIGWIMCIASPTYNQAYWHKIEYEVTKLE